MKPVAIYLILDDAEAPRYVGKTFYPARRKLEHSRRFHWANNLRILEWVSDHGQIRWQDRERYWIAYYRRFVRLENIAKGGGNAGIKSPETIRKFREKMVGRKASPEMIAKRSATIARRSAEERAAIGRRISESKKGKVPNWSVEGKQRTIDALKKLGSPFQGKRHSEYSRKLIGEKSKGHPPNSGSFQKGNVRVRTESWKRNISRALTGRKISDETKRKLSEINSGEKHPKFGTHCSDETKRKISVAHKGKPSNLTPEGRNRIRAAHIGNTVRRGAVLSEETKKKISNTKRMRASLQREAA